ncbi:MAG: hypothetical protein ACOVO0_05815, partial [Burkholderiaceae bacterium]
RPHVRPNAFGNALGNSIARGIADASQQAGKVTQPAGNGLTLGGSGGSGLKLTPSAVNAFMSRPDMQLGGGSTQGVESTYYPQPGDADFVGPMLPQGSSDGVVGQAGAGSVQEQLAQADRNWLRLNQPQGAPVKPLLLASASGNYFGITPSDERGLLPGDWAGTADDGTSRITPEMQAANEKNRQRIMAGATAEGDLRLALDARDEARAVTLAGRQGLRGALFGLSDFVGDTIRTPLTLYRSVDTYGFMGTGKLMVDGLLSTPSTLYDAYQSGDMQTLSATGAGFLLGGAKGFKLGRADGVSLSTTATTERSLLSGGTIDFSLSGEVAPGLYRANPSQLRFMQPTVSPNYSVGGYTVAGTADDLRLGRITPEQLGDPLRVVMIDGKPFSFDNRRLLSYNLGGITDVPIRVMGLDDPKFATQVRDRFNPIRGQGWQVVVVPSVQRTPTIRDLYQQGLVNRKF